MAVVFECSEPWPLADFEENLKKESPEEQLQESVKFLEFDDSGDTLDGKGGHSYAFLSVRCVSCHFP